MLGFDKWLSLPPTLLALILSCASPAGSLEWPYNLPAHVKYYPEEEHIIKRNVEIEQKFSSQTPIGMRKMSDDPGEKFLMDFWQFDTEYTNFSIPLDPVLRPHQLFKPRANWLFARNVKRDFECPSGSFACNSISRPDACCGIGSTCQIVPDTGLGDVGCCPSNQVCGGSVNTCPADYSSCPQAAVPGGCCLPGYACFQQGCVATSTALVVVTPTPSTSTSTSTWTSTSLLPLPPVTSSSSSSSSPTVTPPPTTSRPNSLTCSSGFRSCPASLGGGCCPTGRACGSDFCPEMSSTNSFTAPARPTSGSTTTSQPNVCPTGFYACSAYYQGGCCQIGRNCDKTSCPATASITVVAGSVTVAAPTGSGVTSAGTILTGQCASGWNTCAQSVGGGCCPTGYACGQACTVTAPDGRNSTIGKIAPNEAQRIGMGLVMSVIEFSLAWLLW